MNESPMQFNEDIRRLSKISPEMCEQMIALDLANAGLTAFVDGYADESPYMLYLTQDGVLCGKLEYTFNIDNERAEIVWINAVGYGGVLLAEFEARMLELMPRCTISLICSLDNDERKETVLRRLNFYFKHGYKARDIDYKTARCTHLTFCKTIERNKDR